MTLAGDHSTFPLIRAERRFGRPGSPLRRMAVLPCLAAIAAIAVALAAPAVAAKKLSACPPKTAQLFIAPMGEPFRAGADAPDPVNLWFARLDADHDARISRAEFLADADRFFARLDTDHDGELIPAEVNAYERDIAPEIRLYVARGAAAALRPPTKQERKAAGQYGAPLGAGRWAFLNIPEPVASADADLNRGVSLAEFRAAAADRFALLDKSNRGYLDLAGLPKTPAQAAAAACDPTLPPAAPKPPR